MLNEILIVLLMLGTLTAFAPPVRMMESDERRIFPACYLLAQSEAIASSLPRDFVSAQGVIHFNENGNVRKAGTLHFSNGRKIVIELGGGRLVQR